MNLRANSSERRRTSTGARPLSCLTTLNSMGRPWQSQPGDERRAETRHGLGFDDEVLQNLVERGAHVDIAVGEGRAVVQDEFRRVRPGGLDLAVEIGFLPMPEEQRLALDQIRLHREIGSGQVERVFVARAVAHGRAAAAKEEQPNHPVAGGVKQGQGRPGTPQHRTPLRAAWAPGRCSSPWGDITKSTAKLQQRRFQPVIG